MSPALKLRPSSSFTSTWMCAACTRRLALSTRRFISTDVAPPPLLTKIKGDLKSAMKAKDTARLNVLRSIITETNNASKTSSPVRTDMQILAMLRKRKSSSEAAAQEAADAKREDLKAKQEAEIAVLDEYAGSVSVMSEEDIKSAVTSVIEQLKSAGSDTKAGMVLKELFKASGLLDGKPVEKTQVAKIVNNLLK